MIAEYRGKNDNGGVGVDVGHDGDGGNGKNGGSLSHLGSRSELWLSYKAGNDAESRNRLIGEYFPIVQYHSERVRAGLPRGMVDIRDLRSAGTIALIGAIDGFDIFRGIKFETYASIRVKGSIIDELRAEDWVPRIVRGRANRFKSVLEELSKELGRSPTDSEVSSRLGISSEELGAVTAELIVSKPMSSITSLHSNTEGYYDDSGVVFTSDYDLIPDPKAPVAIDGLVGAEFRDRVMSLLNPREAEIISLYYYDGLTLKDIANHLGLSESRVCQIHGEVINKLKKKLVGFVA